MQQLVYFPLYPGVADTSEDLIVRRSLIFPQNIFAGSEHGVEYEICFFAFVILKQILYGRFRDLYGLIANTKEAIISFFLF